MAKGFFITATDTGVGKTVVAAALIRLLRREGLSVCGMKPLETGCRSEGGELVAADGAFLKEASGVSESLESLAPYRFAEPLAPWVAAERAGAEIDLKRIGESFRELSERYDALVVEGIGGIRVPIKRDYFVSDLAVDLGLPAVVVAPAHLGAINHTLLTLDLARSVGLELAGVVINHPRPSEGTLAEQTNPAAIEELSPAPLIGEMPHLEELSMEGLEIAAGVNLDVEMLRKHL
ncbi:MAG: dethiobiotin synthase [Nitrospirota bacterium]|jgi:dethiobiotin synthetase